MPRRPRSLGTSPPIRPEPSSAASTHQLRTDEALVANAEWAKAAPQGWRSIAVFAVTVGCWALGVVAAIYGTSWLLTRQTGKLGNAIARARDGESWGLEGEAVQITRRALRTIGFALVAIGTFFQLILTLAE